MLLALMNIGLAGMNFGFLSNQLGLQSPNISSVILFSAAIGLHIGFALSHAIFALIWRRA